MQKLPKIGLPVILLIVVVLIFVSKSSINIGYGEAGVLFKTFGGGVVTDKPPLGEGFHIISPWNKVYIYNVKQQEFFEGNMQVLSSNGLEISLDVSESLIFSSLLKLARISSASVDDHIFKLKLNSAGS